MSGGTVTAEPPVVGAPPAAPVSAPGRWRGYLVALGFLGPALVFLGVWIVYPAIRTGIYSFYNPDGSKFVGIDNYKAIFTTSTITTAIKNNAIWIGVVPALVTAIGLVFAVLTERISWRLAFRTIVFMPMAISLFAAGVIWRIMDQQEPSRGTLNATIQVVHDEFSPPGQLQGALPSTGSLTGSEQKGYVLKTPVQRGGSALVPLTGILPEAVPSTAKQATPPKVGSNQIGGVVWRDFKPGGGTPGKVDSGELGLPGAKVQLKDASGKSVGSATTDDNGAFTIDNVGAGQYHVTLAASNFKAPFGGVSWLGPKLITPALILAYIWVWAGFSMVVIAAGLAAIPRDTLEAARTDGATEWQVFRRVTVPLLAPVLTVVFITMLINVLKVFDVVLAVAPQSVQDDANVIALAMWRTAFGPINDYGLGSAIAVFLFILVLPVLLLNIRRFRREG
jgi:alpha-glucoside transport system permease protein